MTGIIMSNWSPEGIREVMREGEEGINVERWGVGLPFRIHAIMCAVSLYDAVFENPKKRQASVIALAMEGYREKAKETKVEMSELLTRQLMYDMYRSVVKVVNADKEAMQ